MTPDYVLSVMALVSLHMQARLSLHWLRMLKCSQNFEQALIEIRVYQAAHKGYEFLDIYVFFKRNWELLMNIPKIESHRHWPVEQIEG